MVADHLQKKSFAILHKNYSVPSGEIDIVAQWRDVIVFVEVKYLSSSERYYPEEQVTVSKQKKIIRAATQYLLTNPSYVHVRFDVVAVVAQGQGRFEIHHTENAFVDES